MKRKENLSPETNRKQSFLLPIICFHITTIFEVKQSKSDENEAGGTRICIHAGNKRTTTRKPINSLVDLFLFFNSSSKSELFAFARIIASDNI